MDHNAGVREAAAARASALAERDAERLRELMHEDFRWTTHVGQVLDRDIYIRRNTEGETVWRSQTLGTTEVAVVGDTAALLSVVTDDGPRGRGRAGRVPDADDPGLGARAWQVAMPGRTRRTTHGLSSSVTLAHLAEPYQPQATLPAGVVDSGFRRGQDRLWLAPDRSRAYVGTAPHDVEIWPRMVERLGCERLRPSRAEMVEAEGNDPAGPEGRGQFLTDLVPGSSPRWPSDDASPLRWA